MLEIHARISCKLMPLSELILLLGACKLLRMELRLTISTNSPSDVRLGKFFSRAPAPKKKKSEVGGCDTCCRAPWGPFPPPSQTKKNGGG